MKLPELPPLPTYPKVPEFEARGLWNAWARAYAVTYGEAVREACAKAAETTPAEAFCTVMHQAQLQKARETFAAAIRKKEE